MVDLKACSQHAHMKGTEGQDAHSTHTGWILIHPQRVKMHTHKEGGGWVGEKDFGGCAGA